MLATTLDATLVIAAITGVGSKSAASMIATELPASVALQEPKLQPLALQFM